MLARLIGGKANGWLCRVEISPVYITMIDRVPQVAPNKLGPASDLLLSRAARKWECYARVIDTESEPAPDGSEIFRCTRALPIYPPDYPPLRPPPANTEAEVEAWLDHPDVEDSHRAELRELLRSAGYGRPE